MEQVIESAPFVKAQKTRLVLLPAQSGYQIRKYLYENGFEIEKEQTVSEKGKYYSCISAVYTGVCHTPDIYDMYIGKSGECTGDDARGYFEMILSQLEKKRKGFEIDNGTHNAEFEKAIEKIRELLR
jgi:tRNA (adenine22-N1)-methyltransferase